MHAALDFTPNNNYNTNNYKHLMGPKSREEAMGIHDWPSEARIWRHHVIFLFHVHVS